jgi:hypothetical protein
MGLQTEEVAAERLFGPVAEFGLDSPMPPLGKAFLVREGVPLPHDLKRGVAARSEFETEIHRGGQIRDQVSFDVPRGQRYSVLGTVSVPFFSLGTKYHRYECRDQKEFVVQFHNIQFLKLVFKVVLLMRDQPLYSRLRG